MAQDAVDLETARALFDRLFDLSREAHELGLYEVAYHALCGAMHAAQSANDPDEVARVADEARDQIDWIDSNTPDHRLSTSSARRHERPGMYAMLQRQAAMVTRMLERAQAGGG